jgi:DNA-directed RNA polymerase specialized sigma24 family protein
MPTPTDAELLDAAHDLTAETFAQAWLARTRFRDRATGSTAAR